MPDFSFDSVLSTCFTPEQIARLKSARVGIAGAGGLGSNCAVALVRSGIHRFTIADFDVVEPGNLNRQAYRPEHLGRPKVECLAEVLREINPAADVDARQLRLDPAGARALFDGCDAVVEAFDKPDAKAWLAGVFLPSPAFYVTASGLAGIGNSDRLTIRRLNATSMMVGDGQTGVGPGVYPYAPCVAIAAAKEADLVLEHLLRG